MQIKAIARLLDMSFHTVQRHLTHAYRKLGVTDGKQAIIRARELGLI
jgi:DNA-binding NarL/FixJ family response regulator